MLSIIIPTYNEERVLPELLKSIQDQDFEDYEVVVADANSTDRTREIAERYGARVVEGGLPGPGRNRGAEAARGSKYLFLDADVLLSHKNFLRNIIRQFDRRGLDIATCGIDPISERRIDKLFHRTYNNFSRSMSRISPFAPGFCILVRSHIHKKINGFDEMIKLAEDHDYTRRAFKYGDYGILDEYLPVSVRRFDKDGRLNIAVKYIFCAIYMSLFGSVRSDIFHYRFGYQKEED